jgi:N-carbamoylputrescine amidase
MVTSLRVAFVEWPEALTTDDSQWSLLRYSVVAAHPDILVTNELPFGPWLAESAAFSEHQAALSVGAHEKGLAGLADLGVPAVISSRPVWNGKRLANEAFVLEKGTVRPLHRKQYFPNEPGWFETEWYARESSGFCVAEILGIKVGVLLCTEAMFNEYARTYGKQEASLIVIPRASGVDIKSWKIAGAMTALVSGAYVVSSNRVGRAQGGTRFGGGGFAFAPRGRLFTTTTRANSLQILDFDPRMCRFAQRAYPCYVPELSEDGPPSHEALLKNGSANRRFH